jgi:hypothetical protein
LTHASELAAAGEKNRERIKMEAARDVLKTLIVGGMLFSGSSEGVKFELEKPAL